MSNLSKLPKDTPLFSSVHPQLSVIALRIAADPEKGIHYNVTRNEAYINKPPSPRDNPTNLSNYFRIGRLYRQGQLGTMLETLNRLQEDGRELTVSREKVEGHECLKVKFTEGGDLSNGKKYEKSLAYWVAPKMSYAVIRMEFRSSRRTGGGEPPVVEGYYASYEESDKFQGIWLLKQVTLVDNQGPVNEKLTASLSETEIGVDIPDSTFTFEGLGVPPGTRVYDKSLGGQPVQYYYRSFPTGMIDDLTEEILDEHKPDGLAQVPEREREGVPEPATKVTVTAPVSPAVEKVQADNDRAGYGILSASVSVGVLLVSAVVLWKVFVSRRVRSSSE